MGEDDKPIEVIVTKKDDDPEESELEKIRKERDDLKQKLTDYALKKRQEVIDQLKTMNTGVPDDVLDTLNPEQIDLMFDKFTKKDKTPTPENKGSGGSGTVPLETPSTVYSMETNPKSVDEWISYYKSKKYEDNVTLLNDVYKVLMSPSLYPKEKIQACDTLAKELLSKWDKNKLPALNFVETNKDRKISSYGKPHR